MTVDITNETELYSDFDFQGLFEKTVQACADYVNVPYEITVSVLLTDDAGIHEINLSERGIDRPTDVLSFPALDYETPGDFSFLEDEASYYFDPDSGELIFGDIVISLDTAGKQAEEYGHSFKREVAFLLTHSMLHLSGYDHMEDEERMEMERMQREILEGLNITRDE
ncbi:MAG: rRNA maturation RNase YbeY [Lachnospiraceae bacterium]|nr:rRNA maturation RNase YbeY [Lachnospiraceae bacterium]